MNFRCLWRARVSSSVHRAVLPLGVSVRVRGNVGGADDDRPSLLLLGARSPLLRALDVLDSLKLDRGRRVYENIFMHAAASAIVFSGETRNTENSESLKGEILKLKGNPVQEKHKYGVRQAGKTPPRMQPGRKHSFLLYLSHPYDR